LTNEHCKLVHFTPIVKIVAHEFYQLLLLVGLKNFPKMANTPSLPVSLLIASKSQSVGSEPQKKTREDWRKAKELEEARKAGTAPAAVDEEGNCYKFKKKKKLLV
jgi:hypothetical protein